MSGFWDDQKIADYLSDLEWAYTYNDAFIESAWWGYKCKSVPCTFAMCSFKKFKLFNSVVNYNMVSTRIHLMTICMYGWNDSGL